MADRPVAEPFRFRSPPPTPVLVRFTDLLSTPSGRRRGDLLLAEAGAQAVLQARGEARAAPRLVQAGDRLVPETPRHDRVGARGRRGLVSLRALHDAFKSPDTHRWPAAAASLAARGLIDTAALRSVRLRHAFGRLIGASDMHFGKLAGRFDDALPFRLAPACDMLPMPGRRPWATPRPRPPSSRRSRSPRIARSGTRPPRSPAEVWRRVAASPLISPGVVAIARAAGETLARPRSAA